VKERAARWQRRYTGPWVLHEVGPVDLSYRYRRRPRAEYLRFWVAWHDLWVHEIARGLMFPILNRLVRVLPGSPRKGAGPTSDWVLAVLGIGWGVLFFAVSFTLAATTHDRVGYFGMALAAIWIGLVLWATWPRDRRP
jgi:hypothetical protein